MIPISADQEATPLRICALVKIQADPAGGHLVTLRTTLDAQIFLGCIVDVAGQVHEWLELWVQNTPGLQDTTLSERAFLTNALFDDRWRRSVRALSELDSARIIQGGWETSNPWPVFLDLAARTPVHPKDGDTGARWELCRDEGILHEKGLPGYSGTLHRYLCAPDLGTETQLVPVTEGAPQNDHTRPLAEVCPDQARLIPLNPAAGLMLVARHCPMSLEDFVDLLSGGSYDGFRHGRSTLNIGSDIYLRRPPLSARAFQGRLFLGARGKYGRLLETFHLKLGLLLDAVYAAYSVVRRLQQPFLNLGADSFRVKLDRTGGAVPFLWTARAQLVEPSGAVAVPVGTSDLRYFVTPLISETSVYQPLATSLPPKGRALVRIRKVVSDSKETVTVEGTFATQERIELAGNDLVAMQLGLTSGTLRLHTHLEADTALASGEWRFRAVSLTLEDALIHDLRSAEGVPLPKVPFEVVPLLSTPCDLYSLAILATRILLVDKTTSLPVAVDEVLSLAREVQAEYSSSEPLTAQVERIFNSDERWLQSLGPHRLTWEQMAPEQARGPVPCDLWWSMLSMILRMFPGTGPASQCRDYGDAPPGGLHTVFEPTLSELESLVLKTRCLVVPDLDSNVQMAAVIRQFYDSQTEQESDAVEDITE